MELKDKKVLLIGLGILGGGVATAKWLCDKEVKLKVTDLKSKEELVDSISQLQDFDIEYTLGGHKEEDLEGLDFVVLNPDVPYDSPFVEEVKKRNIPIENELTLFQKFLKTKNLIAITGTRGKTTTVAWTAFLMNKLVGNTYLAGNSPDNPFLKIVDQVKEEDYVVAEVPSYQLEVIGSDFHPKVSVITNIYRDHINRHYDEENYANIKANILRGQTGDDFAILNKEDKWTEKIIARSEKREARSPKIILVPDESLLPELPDGFGEHNKFNLMVAVSVLKIFGADISKVRDYIDELPQIKMREEKIYEDENLIVINDSAATSPEATIAAVERFLNVEGDLFLITGGTDKGLNYEELGKYLSEKIDPEKLILLGGSATEKLKKSLQKNVIPASHNVIPAKAGTQTLNEFETLEECIKFAKKQIVRSDPTSLKLRGAGKREERSVVVFSPGAKSFEKFKNEFDRGEKFSKLVKEILIR